MTPKPLPTTRVGDQVLLLPKPQVWECDRCGFKVVMLRPLAMEQAKMDHIVWAHLTLAARYWSQVITRWNQ